MRGLGQKSAELGQLRAQLRAHMRLAKELLEKGKQETGLECLGSCRKLWRSDNGKLDEWI